MERGGVRGSPWLGRWFGEGWMDWTGEQCSAQYGWMRYTCYERRYVTELVTVTARLYATHARELCGHPRLLPEACVFRDLDKVSFPSILYKQTKKLTLQQPVHLVMVTVNVVSSEIARAELRCSLNTWTHIYAFPFLCFYPLLAYAYYIKYDDWLKSEEWTFLACVTLGAGHALSFLVTRWNAGAKAWITTTSVGFLYF